MVHASGAEVLRNRSRGLEDQKRKAAERGVHLTEKDLKPAKNKKFPYFTPARNPDVFNGIRPAAEAETTPTLTYHRRNDLQDSIVMRITRTLHVEKRWKGAKGANGGGSNCGGNSGSSSESTPRKRKRLSIRPFGPGALPQTPAKTFASATAANGGNARLDSLGSDGAATTTTTTGSSSSPIWSSSTSDSSSQQQQQQWGQRLRPPPPQQSNLKQNQIVFKTVLRNSSRVRNGERSQVRPPEEEEEDHECGDDVGLLRDLAVLRPCRRAPIAKIEEMEGIDEMTL